MRWTINPWGPSGGLNSFRESSNYPISAVMKSTWRVRWKEQVGNLKASSLKSRPRAGCVVYVVGGLMSGGHWCLGPYFAYSTLKCSNTRFAACVTGWPPPTWILYLKPKWNSPAGFTLRLVATSPKCSVLINSTQSPESPTCEQLGRNAGSSGGRWGWGVWCRAQWPSSGWSSVCERRRSRTSCRGRDRLVRGTGFFSSHLSTCLKIQPTTHTHTFLCSSFLGPTR